LKVWYGQGNQGRKNWAPAVLGALKGGAGGQNPPPPTARRRTYAANIHPNWAGKWYIVTGKKEGRQSGVLF